jgi:hypothetical protein
MTLRGNRSPALTDVDRDAILRARSDMNRSMVAADADRLDELLDPGFSLTHITGYVQPKDEWLHEIQAGSMRYHAIEEGEVEVTASARGATVVTRDVVDATIWGNRAAWRLQMTTTFAHDGVAWIPTDARAVTW